MRFLSPCASRGLWLLQPRSVSRAATTCPAYRPRKAAHGHYSSSTILGSSSSNKKKKKKKKPFYVTTPIFYVNAAPHIGHLYAMVLADVMKRWQELKGQPAFLSTGTDEHGLKIQRAASVQAMQTQAFCDLNSDKFKNLATSADVAYNFFTRTTDPEHKQAVTHYWLQLRRNLPDHLGLYKGTHKGWYCVSDECFYPENMVQPSIVPQTGKKIMINVESEKEVEWIEEDTWFFPLTKYKDALLQLYDSNPNWITPAHRMKEVRNWVEESLEDLSITRPTSRLSWAIADPEDAKQTIYVWVDALINYLTKTGYGTKWQSSSDDMGLWPADLQIVGKDILRFHGVYWPALLLALGLPLPKKIVCHNHWIMSGRKMSKSLGNVVNPFLAIQRWDVDPLRYFLMRNGSYNKDMNYSNQLIWSVYNKELQANIGNLLYRVTRPKATANWSTHEAVSAYREGVFEHYMRGAQGSGLEDRLFSLEPSFDRIGVTFAEEMENCFPGGAIREIFLLLRETNRYVSDNEPWNLVKKSGSEARNNLNWVIYNCVEALRIAGILLQPIMPTKSSMLLDELGVGPERRALKYASKGMDTDYGTRAEIGLEKPLRSRKWDTLFPPVPGTDESEPEVAEQLKPVLRSKTKNKMNRMAELLAAESRSGEGWPSC